MKKFLKVFLSVILSGVLIYLLLSKINIKEIYDTLANASLFYLGVCFFIYLLMGLIRAWRFKILLKKLLSFRDIFNITLFHNFMNNIIPFRMGELSYIYLIKKVKNGSYSKGISTLIIARVFDFLSLVLIFFISLFFSSGLMYGLKIELLLFICGGLVLITLLLTYFLIFKQRYLLIFFNTIVILVSRFNKSLSIKISKEAKRLLKNFEEAKTKKEISLFFISSMLITILSFTFTFFMVLSVGYTVPYGVVVIASSLSILGSLLPIYGVAGFGTVEGVWVLVLSYFNFGLESAIVLSFSFHIIQLLFSALFGIFGWVNLRKSLY
jgi:glycosyltransferase 2 family protein